MNYRGQIEEHETEEIKKLFVGKSVIKTEGDQLILSDGTILKIIPNDGGCVCGAGDYELERLNTFPNIITSVEVKVGPKNPEEKYSDTLYQIFVYSEGIGQSVADIVGDDGNGYYGTGFAIEVKRQEPKPQDGDLRDGAVDVKDIQNG